MRGSLEEEILHACRHLTAVKMSLGISEFIDVLFDSKNREPSCEGTVCPNNCAYHVNPFVCPLCMIGLRWQPNPNAARIAHNRTSGHRLLLDHSLLRETTDQYRLHDLCPKFFATIIEGLDPMTVYMESRRLNRLRRLRSARLQRRKRIVNGTGSGSGSSSDGRRPVSFICRSCGVRVSDGTVSRHLSSDRHVARTSELKTVRNACALNRFEDILFLPIARADENQRCRRILERLREENRRRKAHRRETIPAAERCKIFKKNYGNEWRVCVCVCVNR